MLPTLQYGVSSTNRWEYFDVLVGQVYEDNDSFDESPLLPGEGSFDTFSVQAI